MPTSPPTHRPYGQSPATKRADYNRLRGSSSSRGYGRDWQKVRLRYLQEHPLCQDCEPQGIVTAATEVHHIVKRRDRPDLRLDPANLLGLCEACHSTRTGRGE